MNLSWKTRLDSTAKQTTVPKEIFASEFIGSDKGSLSITDNGAKSFFYPPSALLCFWTNKGHRFVGWRRWNEKYPKKISQMFVIGMELFIYLFFVVRGQGAIKYRTSFWNLYFSFFYWQHLLYKQSKVINSSLAINNLWLSENCKIPRQIFICLAIKIVLHFSIVFGLSISKWTF